MNTLYFDADHSDAERRKNLYAGQLYVASASPNAKKLIEHAQQMIEEAFAPHTPSTAQDHMEVEEYAAVLTDLKPAFIHHPKSKEFVAGLLTDLGADPEKTYFDVPRMRTATSNDYLTTGIAYAFHPHRDTWYSAPQAQLNWWLPIYPVESGNVMAFHSHHWDNPIKNSSRDYNYYEWNRTSRGDAGKHIKKDTRKQPKPEEEPQLDPQVRVVTPPGGVLTFSAAHLHSTVPNDTGSTRFSIDFRTVNLDDLESGDGAPNLDSQCTGTTLRDYLRVTDLEHVPEEIVERYDDETAREGGLVFQPSA